MLIDCNLRTRMFKGELGDLVSDFLNLVRNTVAIAEDKLRLGEVIRSHPSHLWRGVPPIDEGVVLPVDRS